MNDDERPWPGYWEVEGTRCDDHTAVRIRIGVTVFDGTETIALGVAGEAPVAISHHTATEIAQLCEWAITEYELLADIRQQRQTHGKKEELDRAILTHDQWEDIRRILDRDEPAQATTARGALRQLHNAAPASWLGSELDAAR